MLIFILIMMGYAVIKVFFANLKRGGILLIQIAVGSLYMTLLFFRATPVGVYINSDQKKSQVESREKIEN